MSIKKIIIDTDIGDDIDDAYALVSAVKMECFDILGITTVYRNSLQRAKIASALLQALGKTDIGVYAGNDYPYKERFCVEPFETVLPDGRPVIPHYFSEFENMPVSRKSATDFIVEQAEKYPGEVVVVAIGPLTNLAETVRKFPESFAKLAEIVCMGGSFTNDKAEWNIRCDPEAAATVLAAGVPMKFVGIDVTAYTYLDESDIKAIMRESGPETRILNAMLRKWIETHPGRKPTMHDVLTIAEVVGGFCTYKTSGLIIPTEGPHRAITYCSDSENLPVVSYAAEFDRDKFMDFFLNTIVGAMSKI